MCWMQVRVPNLRHNLSSTTSFSLWYSLQISHTIWQWLKEFLGGHIFNIWQLGVQKKLFFRHYRTKGLLRADWIPFRDWLRLWIGNLIVAREDVWIQFTFVVSFKNSLVSNLFEVNDLLLKWVMLINQFFQIRLNVEEKVLNFCNSIDFS
jgi:hypothetical protein